MAKPVGAGDNPLAAGRSPVVAPMVGDGMAGSPIEIIRETRRGQAAFKAQWPEEPSGGSHLPAGRQGASVVVVKRVTTACLCRTADRWSEGTQESGSAKERKTEKKTNASAREG